MRIYLDVCCLGRPFDDQAQDRVHMEAEAVARILARVDNGEVTWVASDQVLSEVNLIPDALKRRNILKLIIGASETICVCEDIAMRARTLADLGFGVMDALHLACAETAEVDAFLTTDDRLEKLALRSGLRVRVMNPWSWLEEVTESEL